MKDTIQEGDIVDMIYNDPEGTMYLDAIVLHVPCDTGDMWHIRYKDQTVFINPCNHYFECVIQKDSMNRLRDKFEELEK